MRKMSKILKQSKALAQDDQMAKSRLEKIKLQLTFKYLQQTCTGREFHIDGAGAETEKACEYFAPSQTYLNNNENDNNSDNNKLTEHFL